MKTILLSACFSFAFFCTSAQHIEVGLHGGYGTTWLFNNNVSDQGDNLDQSASFGPVFGIHGGYYFISRVGVVVEVNYAVVNQKYTGKDILGSFEVVDRLSFVEVPILLRKYSKGGFYFEVGPKFSFLNNATEKVEHSPGAPLFDFEDRDVKIGYRKTVVSAAFGIGGHFLIGQNLYADARLRFAYGFTDATEKYSEAELDQKMMDEQISIGTYFAHTSQQGQYTHKNTNMATGHVLVGITYSIPVIKKAPAAK